MPAILDRLVKQLRDKGLSKSAAYAIATKKLQETGSLKKGTKKPTKKGIAQGKKTPAQRAKERSAKYANKKTSEYKYNAKTNRATLKKKNDK
jgi:hypothetical protein